MGTMKHGDRAEVTPSHFVQSARQSGGFTNFRSHVSFTSFRRSPVMHADQVTIDDDAGSYIPSFKPEANVSIPERTAGTPPLSLLFPTRRIHARTSW